MPACTQTKSKGDIIFSQADCTDHSLRLHLRPAHVGSPALLTNSESIHLDEPFLLALLNSLCEGGVVDYDGSVSTVCRLGPLGLVGVVGALVAEHVADQEHQGAQDGEDHHSDDPCMASWHSYITSKNGRQRYCTNSCCDRILTTDNCRVTIQPIPARHLFGKRELGTS